MVEHYANLLGIKTAQSLALVGVLVMVALTGLALLLVLTRQPAPERGRFWRGLLILLSALLLILGGSGAAGLLAVSIVYQLKLSRVYLESGREMQSEQLNLAILGRPKYANPKKLNRHEYRMFSQNGEDGIIAEIFRRIGTTNLYFVEFGSADGAQNNTAFLLRQGWGGFWIDGDTAAIKRARETFRTEIDGNKLTVTEAFITAENIEELFLQAHVPEEFDLLSIDIDRNDYHVWEKIRQYRPRAIVIEYNGGIPPTMSWVVPYDPKAWGFPSFGSGNAGASLKALEELGTKKGYSLVGCELSGVNAFFIRNDLLGDHFAAPYTADNHYEPFRYYHMMPHHYESIRHWDQKP
jgi:hypothetical protein